MRYSHAQAEPAGEKTTPTANFEGDNSFIGLNLATDRGQLPPGYYARAENKRVEDGVPRKRRGSVTPGFCNAVPYGTILGSGVYSNPNGVALQLIATPPCVWKISDGGFPMVVPIPAGMTLSGAVEFSQHFDKVLLHQAGTGDTPGPTLVWDGGAATGFVVRTKKDPLDTETELVPDTPYSINFAGRMIFPVPGTQDSIGASMIGDHTSWIPGLGGTKFRANAGTADAITGIFGYAQGNLIVGKKQSMDLLSNFAGNLAGVSAKAFAGIGVWARRTWVMDDTAAIFLSGRGVYRLSQADESRLELTRVAEYGVPGTARPDTGKLDPLAPFWRRVNWTAAATTAVAGMDGVYYVLALPIDGSPVNNCLAILNTVSNQWEAIDSWLSAAQMQVDNLMAFNYQGEARLYAVNHRTKSVHLLHQGKFDLTATGRHEIRDLFETRGYAELGWNGATQKSVKTVQVVLGTWRPAIVIEELTERANDVRLITSHPITKRNWRYRNFGKADYDVSNVNDDAEAPGREDYAVSLAEEQEIDFGTGIDLEKTQQHTERCSVKCRGRYVSLRVTSSQGDCDVLGVYVGSSGVQRTMRRAA